MKTILLAISATLESTRFRRAALLIAYIIIS